MKIIDNIKKFIDKKYSHKTEVYLHSTCFFNIKKGYKFERIYKTKDNKTFITITSKLKNIDEVKEYDKNKDENFIFKTKNI